MSLSDSQLHTAALIGTLAIAGALTGPLAIWMGGGHDVDDSGQLKDMVTIEAQLARKSTTKKQPQKELKTPDPVKPPEGISHDETKKVDPPKKDEPKKTDKTPDISKFHHASDDTPQTGGQPTTDIGQFDGSEKGFAPINAGDPYWRELVADFRQVWEIPQIADVKGTPVGCFHIEPDGKIAGLKFDTPSGDQMLDDSVQRAMKSTQKARNDKPQPVPTSQLIYIKKWVCFRFNP